MIVRPGEQDRQGDLVRRLLAVGAFDEGDHAVEERLARLGRDAHDDLVGEDARAAGDRGAVAARLADDRRRLAGDRRLVDRRDALDDVAVGRDDLARGDDALVADVELGRRDVLDRPARRSAVRHRLAARLAQRCRLGLPAAFGHRLREVGEEHGRPQEDRDERREHVLVRASTTTGRGRTARSCTRCRPRPRR